MEFPSPPFLVRVVQVAWLLMACLQRWTYDPGPADQSSLLGLWLKLLGKSHCLSEKTGTKGHISQERCLVCTGRAPDWEWSHWCKSERAKSRWERQSARHITWAPGYRCAWRQLWILLLPDTTKSTLFLELVWVDFLTQSKESQPTWQPWTSCLTQLFFLGDEDTHISGCCTDYRR